MRSATPPICHNGDITVVCLFFSGADADAEFLKDVGSNRGKSGTGGGGGAEADQPIGGGGGNPKNEKMGLLTESSSGKR